MNAGGKTPASSSLLTYFSLFTSLGTLLCCALPSLLVLAGLGASFASALSTLPWLVTLSRHKPWVFAISGSLIFLSFVNTYYVAPRVRAKACAPDSRAVCDETAKIGKALLWMSAAIYGVGFFTAFLLGSILSKMDAP
jgi:mercuric ion transport protein